MISEKIPLELRCENPELAKDLDRYVLAVQGHSWEEYMPNTIAHDGHLKFPIQGSAVADVELDKYLVHQAKRNFASLLPYVIGIYTEPEDNLFYIMDSIPTGQYSSLVSSYKIIIEKIIKEDPAKVTLPTIIDLFLKEHFNSSFVYTELSQLSSGETYEDTRDAPGDWFSRTTSSYAKLRREFEDRFFEQGNPLRLRKDAEQDFQNLFKGIVLGTKEDICQDGLQFEVGN